MQRKTLICNNFSGINRSSSVYSSSVITAVDMQNVELFSTEANSGVGIRTSKGNIAIGDDLPAGEEVVDIYESVQNSVSNFFVYAESSIEGKIYLFTPSDGVLSLKVSGLTPTGKSSATDVSQGWSDLWIFSNGEEMLSIELGKLDENDNPDEVTMMEPVDMDGRLVKGLGLVIFAGRLWVFNGQVLWYSVQENVYDFSTSDAEIATSSGYIEFVKKITAIYPYLGVLAVFHKNSSEMISPNSDGLGFSKSYDSPGGCAGHKSLVFHGTQLYFYDDTKKGIFSFLQVINGDKTLGENIAVNIQDELLSVSPKLLSKIHTLSVVTSDRNEVWFLIPSESKTHSMIMIYDYLRRTWVKRKSQKINCVAIIGDKLYSGGGNIYEEYKSENFNGQYMESFYKCAPLNLGVENSLKILSYPPKVTLDTSYSNDFYIEYTKDYNLMTQKTRHVKSKSLKDVLHFDLDNWDFSFYPPEKFNVIKSLPSAYFKTLQMRFFTNHAGQGFCIKNIEFGKIKVKQ